MGANLQSRTFDLNRDWMGHENACEILNLSRPEVIREIHEAFLSVGCDAVETNTFNGSREDLVECELADRTTEVNRLAAENARKACEKFETPDSPKYVVGSIGPGRKLLTLGMTDWASMEQSYYEQMLGLIQGSADVLLIETQQDMLASKCCIVAANRAMKDAGKRIPIMVQFSFDQDGGQQTLTGSDPSAVVATFLPYEEVNVLGLNCAFGPPELTESTRFIAENWPRFVSALPNAGLPVMVDGKTKFPMTPADFTKGMLRFVNDFGVNIVGGCCGRLRDNLKRWIGAFKGTNPRSNPRRAATFPAPQSPPP